MASVQRVYAALKALVNKDQKGFVTPQIFNNFASVAQTNIYNRLFDEQKNALRFRRAGIDAGREMSKQKQIKEDLSTFIKVDTLTSPVSGVFTKPSDLGRIISIRTGNTFSDSGYSGDQVSIIYDQDDIDRVLSSSLSAPTSGSPVALVSSGIEIFPTNITSLKIRYYKLPEGLTTANPPVKSPAQPRFGYSSSVAGVELYLDSASIDFELPEHYFGELVIEIAQLIGVNLRDVDIVNYSSAEITKEENN